MLRPARIFLLSALALISACTTTPIAVPQPVPSAPYTPIERLEGPQTIPGWADEDHLAAFQAYADACGVTRELRGKGQCERARDIRRLSRPVTPSMARSFFEQGFDVVEVEGPEGQPGLLTAYFAPEYEARRSPDTMFDTPVLPRPVGWTRGQVLAARAEIEAGPPPSPPLAWMRAEDLFFLQIQGSGYLTFPDSTTTRASYAADNGRPFVGIARPMAERGLLPADGTSGDVIRGWLAAHRGAEARAITALNPRYIYFELAEDDGGDPAGAAGIPLPPRRAIAIDPVNWAYGDLIWISASAGALRGARHSYQGLVVALDTGSAIRGPVRADLYMGRGRAAGEEAGAVRHPLRMWRLVPH